MMVWDAVEEIKEKANEVTRTNNENGIGIYLERIISKKDI